MHRDRPIDAVNNVDDDVDEMCDAFETVLRRGERPRIGEYIEQVDEFLRQRLFYELPLVELDYRRSQGERPSREEYLQKLPTFVDQIEAPFHLTIGAFARPAALGAAANREAEKKTDT